jgi:hypothetical protein
LKQVSLSEITDMDSFGLDVHRFFLQLAQTAEKPNLDTCNNGLESRQDEL